MDKRNVITQAMVFSLVIVMPMSPSLICVSFLILWQMIRSPFFFQPYQNANHTGQAPRAGLVSKGITFSRACTPLPNAPSNHLVPISKNEPSDSN
jgi:hypothetical protein